MDMQPRWALLGADYWLSMRHGCAFARVQDKVLSIDMWPLWHISWCSQLAIDETQLCLCVWRVAVSTGLRQHLVNRHVSIVDITRCNQLALDETRLCLCVRTCLRKCLVSIHVAAVGIIRCSLLAIDETGYAFLCGNSLQAQAQDNDLSINMRPLRRITWCFLLAIDETRLCLCVRRLTACTGLSQRLKLIVGTGHAAAVGIIQSFLLDIDETCHYLCVRRFAAGAGLSQCLVNRHAAAIGIIQCSLFAIDEAWLCLCVR
ncbi:hypothetical protein HAX54_034493 [Datura stramonium]|uniref:Uncharacterized protein n=1 Tax=Datura stramonium TaxID=4076 RepID=A0ABS8VFH2_DATST|nr:hypothetical protein [Datura stramonium]